MPAFFPAKMAGAFPSEELAVDSLKLLPWDRASIQVANLKGGAVLCVAGPRIFALAGLPDKANPVSLWILPDGEPAASVEEATAKASDLLLEDPTGIWNVFEAA